jgi:RNA 2',3'-cyclic 3'-phosphodiesterase
MSQTIRTFIAMEINEQIRRELTRVQDTLRHANADVKWTEPENIHLTIKFLGDAPVEKLPEINSVLDQTAGAFHPFDIEIQELGAFPNSHAPRIIWAGVTRQADQVTAIASMIESGLEPLGFKKEDRAFSAHITLGRARSPDGKVRLSRAIAETALPAGLTQKISRLTLFQSQLTSSGPVYSTIHQSALA